MANMDPPQADAAQPHPDTELEIEEQAEQQELQQAFAGLWVILAIVAVVIVGGFLFFSFRAHTPALSPGQPEKSSAVAVLGGGG